MTDALRHELPGMLEEHDLALHARTEEEVLYPAAILVGDLLRTRGE